MAHRLAIGWSVSAVLSDSSLNVVIQLDEAGLSRLVQETVSAM